MAARNAPGRRLGLILAIGVVAAAGPSALGGVMLGGARSPSKLGTRAPSMLHGNFGGTPGLGRTVVPPPVTIPVVVGHCPPAHCRHCHGVCVGHCFGGVGIGFGGGYSYYDSTYPRASVVGVVSKIDPELGLGPPSSAPASVPVDPALVAMRAADYSLAASILKANLIEDASDAESMRRLAIAFLGVGGVERAALALRQAYEVDPLLAGRPLDATMFGGPAELRALLLRAVHHANRDQSPDAWLLVTTIMQAEGRAAPARRMVERAERAGLKGPIAEELRQALGMPLAMAAP